MLALGLNIVVGYAGLLDLGYVAVLYAVGAYLFGLLASPHLRELAWFAARVPNGLHLAVGW